MKRAHVLTLGLLAAIVIGTASLAALSESPVPEKAWSKIQVDPNPAPVVQDQEPVVYEQAAKAADASAVIPNNPDVAVTTATNTTQSENSIFMSPTNPQILLNSNNSSNWPVSVIYGASYWVSTNGGATWTGSTAGAGGANNGDPAAAIDLSGRMYIGYISATGGMGVSYSTNNGSNWTARTVSSKGSLDKEHIWVDNSPTSAFSGRLYDAWSNFLTGDPNVNDIEISRSTDAGVSWSAAVNISNAVAAGSHNQGVNIQTGPNGEVYVTWAVYDAWPANEVALGFTKSLDGGATWSTATRIRTINGTRNTLLGGSKTMRHASFPSMTVNQQSGKIYIAWTNVGVPGIGSGDFEIYAITSTDGGTSWSAPVRVNQDTQGNGKDQWMPWLACDAVTGDVSCIFYDSRNFVSNNAAETFVAVSQDHGATWTDSKVSDFSWSGDGIVGFASNYAGDYLGISARDGNIVPCWGDDHSGNFLTYVSPFTLTSGPVPPVAQFAGAPTSGCAPLTVNFTDQSTGTPTSWSWTFGDGGTSTLQNPSYSYAAAGIYTVSLTVTNAQGSNTNTKPNYITVNTGTAPVADFSGTPLTGQAPLAVAFTDLSTGAPTAWSWTFGDGGTSTLQNPSHTYTAAGSFSVSLTATNACGANASTKPGYVTVSAPPTPEMYVAYQNAGRISAGGKRRRGVDTVEVRLVSGNTLVSGASVTVSYSGTGSGTATGTSGANGRVVLQTATVNKPAGQWCFAVTSVTKTGHLWNSGAPGSDNSECENDKLNSLAISSSDIVETDALMRIADDDGSSSIYPNPFNAGTIISFTLREGGDVALAVYDVLGREVRQLSPGYLSEGTHTVAFDATDNRGARLASGMYFYRLITPAFTETKKMVLLK